METLGEQLWAQGYCWESEVLPGGGLYRYPVLDSPSGLVAKVSQRGEGRFEGVVKTVNLQRVMDGSDPMKRQYGVRQVPVERSEKSVALSARRARVSVRGFCQEIGADRLVTFGTRSILSLSDLLVRFQRFVDAYEYAMDGKWVRCAVPELHKDGVHYHLHVAVAGWFSLAKALNIWHGLCGADDYDHEINGSINVKKFTLRTAQDDVPSVIGGYIAKYLGKGLASVFNKKSYWASRRVKADVRQILLKSATLENALSELSARFGIDWASVMLTHKGCFFMFPDESGFWFRVTPLMHRVEIPFSFWCRENTASRVNT